MLSPDGPLVLWCERVDCLWLIVLDQWLVSSWFSQEDNYIIY